MGMENFEHRRAARIVAYVDAVFTGITMILLLVFFGLSVYGAVAVAEIAKRPEFSKFNDQFAPVATVSVVFLVIVWILVLVNLIIACVELWAVLMFLKATKHGADVSQAIRWALILRNVMVVFLTSVVVFSLSSGEWYGLGLHVIVRATMLYFVIKSIKEMEAFVLASGSRLPAQHVPI